MVKAYTIMVDEDTEALKYNRLEMYRVGLKAALRDQGISIETTTLDFKKLCREALKARIEFWKIEAERLQGNYSNDFDKFSKNRMLFQAAIPQGTRQPLPVPSSTPTRKSFSLKLWTTI